MLVTTAAVCAITLLVLVAFASGSSRSLAASAAARRIGLPVGDGTRERPGVPEAANGPVPEQRRPVDAASDEPAGRAPVGSVEVSVPTNPTS